MKKQQGHAGLTVIIIIMLIILGVLGYLFYKNMLPKEQQVGIDRAGESSQKAAETKEFRSKEHDITFHYPSDWTVEETFDDGNTAEWYASTVKVFDANHKELAMLGTGGQYGGACDENAAPFINISTIIKDPLDLEGVGKTNFGYTIVKLGEDNYRIAFGLAKDVIAFGDSSVQCPAMAVNYNYIASSNLQVLGGIMFGQWYNEGDNGVKHQSFTTLGEAKAYAKSDEFGKIKTMISSLAIGK